jgi:hypothetical protein
MVQDELAKKALDRTPYVHAHVHVNLERLEEMFRTYFQSQTQKPYPKSAKELTFGKM